MRFGFGGVASNSSLSGGTFNCGSGATVFFDAVNFTQSGGTLQLSERDHRLEQYPSQSQRRCIQRAGGTMTLGTTLGNSLGLTSAATFNHDGGTLVVGGDACTFNIQNATASTLDLNNPRNKYCELRNLGR
jgi:hypothetical protein